MTTLRKEAFLIKDRLAGGNSALDDQLDERDIIMYYRGVMRDVLQTSFYQHMDVGDKGQIPMYIAFYPDIEVKKDDKDDVKYIDLPSFYMDMPHNKGIVHIAPASTPEKQIFMSANPYVAELLPNVSNMEGRSWGWPEGLKFKFSHHNWNPKWVKINIKLLIPAPDSIGENDNLPIIPNQMNEIRNRVTEFFQRPIIQDVLNDGNKDRGVNTQ